MTATASQSSSVTTTSSMSYTETGSLSASVSATPSSTTSPSGTATSTGTASVTTTASLTPSHSETSTTSLSRSVSTTATATTTVSSSSTQTVSLSDSTTVSRQIYTPFDAAGLFLFAPHYMPDAFASRRFMVRQRSVLGPPAAHVVLHVPDHRTDTHLAVFHTTSRFDYVSSQGQRCDRFVDTANPTNVSDTPTSAIACRTPLVCFFGERAPEVGEHLFHIRGGPALLSPTCMESLVLFGQVAVRGSVTSAPLYYALAIAGAGDPTPSSLSQLRLSSRAVSLITSDGSVGATLWRGVNTSGTVASHAPPALGTVPTVGPTAIAGQQYQAAECVVHDAASFTVNPGLGVGALLACSILDGDALRPCRSLDEYHAACVAHDDCVGYSSILHAPGAAAPLSSFTGDFTEQPLRLHTGTAGAQPVSAAGLAQYGATARAAMYYEKPAAANRTCVFDVATAGRVAVYLAQSDFAEGLAQVLVSGGGRGAQLAAECGGLKRFAHGTAGGGPDELGTFGAAGRCDDLVLCAMVEVPTGGQVLVRAHPTLLPSSCDAALTAMVNYTAATVVNASARDPLPLPPLESAAVLTLATQASAPGTVVDGSVYVHGASLLAVGVQQSQFQCTDAAPCVDPVVVNASVRLLSATATTPLASCGGLAGFPGRLHNGTALSRTSSGRTGACNDFERCGAAVDGSFGSSSAKPFSGLVVARAAADFFTTRPSPFRLPQSCRSFAARVEAVPMAGAAVPVLPLVTQFGRRVPLLALAVSDPAVAAGNVTAAVRTALANTTDAGALFGAGPSGAGRRLLVHATALRAAVDGAAGAKPGGDVAGLVAAGLALNATAEFGCVVDTVSGAQDGCAIPVPAGSNFMALQVAQSDFAANTLRVEFVDASGAVQRTISCGGFDGFANGEAGASAACAEYRECGRGFLYEPGAGTGGLAAVRVVVSSDVTARGEECDFALTAVVAFERRSEIDPGACSGKFFCGVDRTCLDPELVCDGAVAHCADGSDESHCRDWRTVATDRSIVDAGVAAGVEAIQSAAAATVADEIACRQFAVVHGAVALEFDRVAQRCRVFNATAAAIWAERPSRYMERDVGTPGAVLMMRLADPATYQRCATVLHCNSRGVIKNEADLNDGDRCLCVCQEGWGGRDCSVALTVGANAAVAAVFPLPAGDGALPLAAVESALSGGNTAVTTRIRELAPFNATHLAVFFVYFATDASVLSRYTTRLLRPDGLAAINAVARRLHVPQAALITAIDGLSTFATVGPCTVTGNVSHCTVGSVDAGRLKIDASGVALSSVTLQLAQPLGSSRRAAGAVHADCTARNSLAARKVSGEKCYASQCVIDVPPGAVVSGLDVVAEPSHPTCGASAALLFTARLELPNGTTAAAVSVTTARDTELLFGAAASFGVGLLAVTAGCVLLYLVYTALRRASDVIHRGIDAVSDWFSSALKHETAFNGRFNTEIATVGVFVVCALIVVVAGFLLVLFATSSVRSSNFSVLVELYHSPVCDGAGTQARTLPYAAAALEATDECKPLAFVGDPDGAVEGRVRCEAAGDGYAAHVVFTSTERQCLAAVPAVFSTSSSAQATCMPQAGVVPAVGSAAVPSGYMRVRCVETTVARRFTASLGEHATQQPQSVPVNVTSVVPQLAAPLPGRTAWTYAARGAVRTADAGVARVVATQRAAPAALASSGVRSARLAVRQPPSTLSFEAAAHDAALTAAPAEEFPMGAAAAATAPPLSVAQGFEFGGFETVDEVSGSAAGPSAQRYFGIKDGPFDAGAQFTLPHFRDSDGLTLELWLRATETTDGFAFATADGLENAATRRNVPLDRLLRLVQDGATTSRPWFARGLHVYTSLYVNGRTRTLRFTSADPAEEGHADALLSAQWQLDEMGIGHVFNGRWHHIAVSFGNENDHSFAVLVVDGRTFLTDAAWRKCLPRRLTPVRSAEGGRLWQELGVARREDSVAAEGGVLYVGYLNAGVAGLRFTPKHRPAAAHVRDGTRVMRVNAARRHTGIISVFGAMLLCSCAVVAYIGYQFFGMYTATSHAADATAAALKANYLQFRMALHTGPETFFQPMTYASVRTALGKDDGVFRLFVDECIAAPLDESVPGQYVPRFVRALWLQYLSDSGNETPSEPVLNPLGPEAAAATQAPRFDETDELRPTDDDWATVCAYYDNAAAAADDGGVLFSPVASPPAGGAGRHGRDKFNNKTGMRALKTSMSTALLAAITTLQSSAIYISTWSAPESYDDNVGPIMSFFTLDIFGSNTLVAPIVQLCVGLALLAAISLVLLRDDTHFYGNVARYQHRRDRQLGYGEARKIRGEALRTVDPTLFAADGVACGYRYAVHVLSPFTRLGLARLRARKGSAGEVDFGTHTARKSDDEVLELREKADVASEASPLTANPVTEGLGVCGPPQRVDPVADMARARLETISPWCSEHRWWPLVPIEHSSVSPYVNRRQCCVVERGRRCNQSEGRLWCCLAPVRREPTAAEEARDAQDSDSKTASSDNNKGCCARRCGLNGPCGYAVCDKHMQHLEWYKTLPLGVAGSLHHNFLRNGLQWLALYVFVTLALVLYTPVMRTAIMVLVCHPLYQCEFPQCWGDPDQKFIAAAYLCLVIILLYGLGLPAVLAVLLRNRVKALSEVFTGALYDHAFTKLLPRGETVRAKKQRLMHSLAYRVLHLLRHLHHRGGDLGQFNEVAEQELGSKVATLSSPHASFTTPKRTRDSPHLKPFSSFPEDVTDDKSHAMGRSNALRFSTPERAESDAASLQLNGDDDEAEDRTTDTVTDEEWARFLLSDVSILTPMYHTVTFEQLVIVPLLHVVKFSLLVPPLLLEPDSFAQLCSIACGEVLYCLLLTGFAPYIGHWMAVVIGVSSLHQFVIVGLQAYAVAMALDEDVSGVVGPAMVATTFGYAVVLVAIGLFMFVGPSVHEEIVGLRASALFKRLRIDRVTDLPLFVDPVRGTTRHETEGEESTAELPPATLVATRIGFGGVSISLPDAPAAIGEVDSDLSVESIDPAEYHDAETPQMASPAHVPSSLAGTLVSPPRAVDGFLDEDIDDAPVIPVPARAPVRLPPMRF